MNNTYKISILKQVISSLEQNLNYIENINDHSKIESYKDFIFSRIFDKLSTLGINYIRILLIIDNFKIKDSENISSSTILNQKYSNESDVELITSILRPLFELYLELKSYKLTLSKLKDLDEAIELVSHIIYLEDSTSYNEMKLNVSKDFYNCEPLYLKMVSENNKKGVNELRIDLTKKNIPLLKNIRNKFLDVVKNNNKQERLLLGMDYLTSYAFLSKKTHFSYSNVISDGIGKKMLLNWSLVLFIGIYRDITELLKFEDNFSKTLVDEFEILNRNLDSDNLNNITIGNYGLFDFGIAKIVNKENLNLHIEFVASNCFERGTKDIVPKIFLQKEVTEEFFNITHTKYYDENKILYIDSDYEKMHFDLMKNSI